jgi:hypothetical protein
MRIVPVSLLLACAVAAAAPSPAHASEVRLLGGADVIFNQEGAFELLLAGDAPLARRIAVTGRVGALVTTSSGTAGVPIDAGLRINAGRLYLEGLVGPWIVFKGDAVRGHAAFGFGLQSREVSFGVEVGTFGFSGGNGMLGARLGVRL